MQDLGLIDWLLDSDPALRWQVERDLLLAPEEIWAATHARVASEGFGARLLALQDPDGQWASGAFFPADFDHRGPEAAEGAGQPWTATTWTLCSLRDWGPGEPPSQAAAMTPSRPSASPPDVRRATTGSSGDPGRPRR